MLEFHKYLIWNSTINEVVLNVIVGETITWSYFVIRLHLLFKPNLEKNLDNWMDITTKLVTLLMVDG